MTQYLLPLLLIGSSVFAQTIDNSFESLSIPEIHQDFKTVKKSRSIFPSKRDSVILFEQSLLQLYGGDFVVDKSGTKTGISYFPDTCKYFSDGTKVLLIGAADNESLESGGHKKCVSFRITNMPEIGDTAYFEFLLLTLLPKQELNPQIYFSKKLLAGKHDRILNYKKFVYYGRFDRGSFNTADLSLCKLSIPMSKKFKKYKWIHLVTDYRRGDMGLILPRNLSVVPLDSTNEMSINKIDSGESHGHKSVLFASDSFELDNVSKELIDSIINFLITHPSYAVSIQGYASKEGNLEYNLILAQKRSESVVNYFLSNNISVKRIQINTPGIGNFPANELNRSCTIHIIQAE